MSLDAIPQDVHHHAKMPRILARCFHAGADSAAAQDECQTREEPKGQCAMPVGEDLFRDRYDGGRRLAALLAEYAGRQDVIVLALPRGGVPVGFEVARALRAPLDVFLVRKIGVPGHEELAMGAIATGGVRVLNYEVIAMEGVPPQEVEAETARQWQELWRRERLYRDDRPPPDVRGRVVIITDDGIATGSTMRAAVVALRALEPARIVVAVPVASERTCQELGRVADVVVCARTPEPFYAVGRWYVDFAQTTDAELRDLLEAAQVEGARQETLRDEAGDGSPGGVSGDA
jgi:putative phosphoribosyl transferase